MSSIERTCCLETKKKTKTIEITRHRLTNSRRQLQISRMIKPQLLSNIHTTITLNECSFKLKITLKKQQKDFRKPHIFTLAHTKAQTQTSKQTNQIAHASIIKSLSVKILIFIIENYEKKQIFI